MKIAITTEKSELNSYVSPVFGRSHHIIIVNIEDDETREETVLENPARFEKGAGNMAADFLVKQGVDILISGEMGPVAFYILSKAGIAVYKASPLNIEKNLELLNAGKLREITSLSSGYPKK